jgi:hypothetical protein
MAGVNTVEGFGNIVANPAREMSANYAIGNDGTIGLFCPESDRSWCSASQWNDNRAITIEVSNSMVGGDWPVSDAAYKSLIDLCVDICQRNGIPKLEFTGDQNGSLTFHYMFWPTACLPIDRTELLTPNGWKLLKDIRIGDTVATAHIDNMSIMFDTVENMVPVKTQDTYTTRDFEATSDHRIVYYNQNGKQYVGLFKDVFNTPSQFYFMNAGYIYNQPGFAGLTMSDIEFLVAVQADGHYMKDGNCKYGVEFHLSKERKIKRLKKLFKRVGLEYKECNQSDGTTKLRVYGKEIVEHCEEYLHDKCFTWEWLNMNYQQVNFFMDAILQYDGCEANNSYSSSIPINIDIVQAIAAINGIGTKITKEHDRVYFKKYRRSLGKNVRKRNVNQQVSCVTVRSGFILIRQHGRTTITGNCPGPWIKARAQEICDKVNARLNAGGGSEPNKPDKFKSHTVRLKTTDPVYKEPGGKQVGFVGKGTVFTIVEESIVNNVKYGKLKSGKGWVVLETIKTETPKKQPKAVATRMTPKQDNTIRQGDFVKISPNAKYYTGAGIPLWVINDVWYVDQINGDRVVLGKNQSDTRNIQSPINVSYLSKVSTSSTSITNNDIVKGSIVKVLNPIIYGTTSRFMVYVPQYYVLEVVGDRVVISSDGVNVTTAISKSNLQKIK